MAQELRTKKEIKAKIASEKKQRKTLPERSMFGDNNWETIDNNVAALNWVLDNYDLYDVKDKIEDVYAEYDETSEEFQDSDYEKMGNAVSPYEWAINDRDDF